MHALKGRASYLGPRSVGHEDPGAASTALIIARAERRRHAAGPVSPSVRFRGLPVSEGTATGRLHVADLDTAVSATPDEVRDAFTAVAAQRSALAERLRGAGRDDEAAIIDVGALIAADVTLVGPAVAAMRGGTDAATAVRQAAEAQAAVIEALPSPELAERAGDVRQVADAVLDASRPSRPAAAPGR